MQLEIPVVGPPLAGKSSLLLAIAAAFSVAPRIREATLTTIDQFNGMPTRVFEVTVTAEQVETLFWCIPGGCLPEWPLQFQSKVPAAIFVADAQRAMHSRNDEFWRALERMAPLERWFVALTKCDLTPNAADQAIPSSLLARPRIAIGSHDPGTLCSLVRPFVAQIVNVAKQAAN